jgi:hypothetical protein
MWPIFACATLAALLLVLIAVDVYREGAILALRLDAYAAAGTVLYFGPVRGERGQRPEAHRQGPRTSLRTILVIMVAVPCTLFLLSRFA